MGSTPSCGSCAGRSRRSPRSFPRSWTSGSARGCRWSGEIWWRAGPSRRSRRRSSSITRSTRLTRASPRFLSMRKTTTTRRARQSSKRCASATAAAYGRPRCASGRTTSRPCPARSPRSSTRSTTRRTTCRRAWGGCTSRSFHPRCGRCGAPRRKGLQGNMRTCLQALVALR